MTATRCLRSAILRYRPNLKNDANAVGMMYSWNEAGLLANRIAQQKGSPLSALRPSVNPESFFKKTVGTPPVAQLERASAF